MPAAILLRLTGGASNANPNLSLGAGASDTVVSATPLNNLFDDVSAAEAADGRIEYRAVALLNAGNEAAVGVTIHMSTNTSSPDSKLSFGLSANGLSVPNESTAPSGVTFSDNNAGNKLSIPNINAGAYAQIWIRRTISANASNTSSDTGTITWEFA